MTIKYLSKGTINDAEATDKSTSERNIVQETRAKKRLTGSADNSWNLPQTDGALGFTKRFDTPVPLYTIDDARNVPS
jgi:hypothetical protein